MLTENGCLQLYMDGIAEEPIQYCISNGQLCYAIFDLYGQCQQVGVRLKLIRKFREYFFVRLK